MGGSLSLTPQGYKTDSQKVQAITENNKSTPKNSRSLKLSWFGELLQLIHPKLADLIALLRVLCNKGALYGKTHCKKHFETIKKKSQVHKCSEMLTSQSQVSSNRMHLRGMDCNPQRRDQCREWLIV